MATTTENTAPVPAPSLTDLEVTRMSKEDGIREAKYQAAMHMARNLLKQGVIDEEDYRKFDTKMTEKYHPILGSLFSDLRLVNLDK